MYEVMNRETLHKVLSELIRLGIKIKISLVRGEYAFYFPCDSKETLAIKIHLLILGCKTFEDIHEYIKFQRRDRSDSTLSERQ